MTKDSLAIKTNVSEEWEMGERLATVERYKLKLNKIRIENAGMLDLASKKG